jgi:hypothetical protein
MMAYKRRSSWPFGAVTEGVAVAAVEYCTAAVDIDTAACLSACVGRRDAAVKPTGMYSRRRADRSEALSM